MRHTDGMKARPDSHRHPFRYCAVGDRGTGSRSYTRRARGTGRSTPQGVVQRYSTAVIDGDTATANSYLTEAAKSSCGGFRESGALPTRVVLISAAERDNSALVKVSVVGTGSGGPFGPSEYEMEDRFSLVKPDGKWLIDQAPYQLLSCTGTSVKP